MVAPPVNFSMLTVSDTARNANKSASNLRDSVAREKEQSQKFEDYLLKALVAGDNPDLDLTLNCDDVAILEGVPTDRKLTVPIFTTPFKGKWDPSSADCEALDPESESLDDGDRSLLEGLSELNTSLNSLKTANKLFEMKLKSFLTD